MPKRLCYVMQVWWSVGNKRGCYSWQGHAHLTLALLSVWSFIRKYKYPLQQNHWLIWEEDPAFDEYKSTSRQHFSLTISRLKMQWHGYFVFCLSHIFHSFSACTNPSITTTYHCFKLYPLIFSTVFTHFLEQKSSNNAITLMLPKHHQHS